MHTVNNNEAIAESHTVYDIDTLASEIENLEDKLKIKEVTYRKLKGLKTNNILKINKGILELRSSSTNDVQIGPFSSQDNWDWYLGILEDSLPLHKTFSGMHSKSGVGFSVRGRLRDIRIKSKFIAAAFSVMYIGYNVIAKAIGNSGYAGFSGFMVIVVQTAALYALAYNLANAILNYYNFVVYVNKYVNSVINKDADNIIGEYEEKAKLLKAKKDLLEAAKATRIRPKSIVEGVKRTSAKGMLAEIEDVREALGDMKRTKCSEKLEEVLGKCESLLGYCASDGKALSEISSIYNIYIKEVLDTLQKYGETREAELLEMLNNFDLFIDNKINKYRAISEIEFNSDIGTLNKIFKSEM